MARKIKLSDRKAQEVAQTILDAVPQGAELSVMDLLQFGSSELLKEAVAREITAHLGREHYRHLTPEQEFKGQRNGYRKTPLDTPIGQVIYDRPLVAYAPDFKSRYHKRYAKRPQEFASAIADMHINGVATRNVKRALKAVSGEKVHLSKSTVSRITKHLVKEFKAWQARDLSKLNVAYLIVDAIRVKMRQDSSPKQSVMIAYAILYDGSFQTLSIAVKNAESNATWESFIADLKRRGLKDPLLVVSDGNDGAINGIDKCFPTSWRQRCVRHKVENVLESVPKEKHDEVRVFLNRIFYDATSLPQAKLAVEDFKLRYRKLYPSAVECLERDLAQCLTFYLFPVSHWRRIRTSNHLERMNLEIKRRLKSIGRHPSESGCLSLIYRICMQYEDSKKGFRANDLVQELWTRLREKKIEMIPQLELDLEAA